METIGFDIAIFGSDPLALLSAGLLAERHGRKVCLVARPFALGQLPRGIDISVAPATRPALWHLTSRLVPETRTLIEGIGGATVASEPILVGSAPITLEALQHMRHVAMGTGVRVTRVADTDIGEGSVGYRFNGAWQLDRARLIPILLGWLDTLGVYQTGLVTIPATLRRDGSVRLALDDRTIVADRAAFLDAEAVATHLPAAARDPLLQLDPGRGILTEPARQLPSSTMLYLDRGATLSQSADGSITALLRGNADTAFARLGACLAAQGPLRRAAEARIVVVECSDGAPLVGTVRGSRARIVVGLGPWSAFFAPAIVRWIEGSTGSEEADSLASLSSQRVALRPTLADFSAPRCLAGAS